MTHCRHSSEVPLEELHFRAGCGVVHHMLTRNTPASGVIRSRNASRDGSIYTQI